MLTIFQPSFCTQSRGHQAYTCGLIVLTYNTQTKSPSVEYLTAHLVLACCCVISISGKSEMHRHIQLECAAYAEGAQLHVQHCRPLQVHAQATHRGVLTAGVLDKELGHKKSYPSELDGQPYKRHNRVQQQSALRQIGNLPGHVAVIMDGNSRWAKNKGLPVQAGHAAGVRAFLHLVEECQRLHVNALTVFAFSIENWHRDQEEVQFLMQLFEQTLKDKVQELHDAGVRLSVIGNRQLLPAQLNAVAASAEDLTAANTDMHLTLALSYGGRQDIMSAVQRVAQLVADGHLSANQVTENVIQRHLSSQAILEAVGPPDLVIRTSGEQRLSNFMLWEAAYAELYFTDVLWPDFSNADLHRAFKDYASRQRRYGRRF